MNLSLKIARFKRELEDIVKEYFARREAILEAHGKKLGENKYNIDNNKRESANSALKELDESLVDIVVKPVTIKMFEAENKTRTDSGKGALDTTPELMAALLDLEDTDTGEPAPPAEEEPQPEVASA